MRQEVEDILNSILSGFDSKLKARIEIPADLSHGDFTTNIAFQLAKILQKSPLETAELLADRLQEQQIDGIEKIEAIKPAFVNFWLKKSALLSALKTPLAQKVLAKSAKLSSKKIMVEYAHPNTHKEMHIGHMRTLVTGEAIARILEAVGADVFRANYQGDIGAHIAKALYGIEKLISEQNLSLEELERWPHQKQAHFLADGYVRGSRDYEAHKKEIDDINSALYQREEKAWSLYQKTRVWNLQYFDEFYKRFDTKFDRLFFESEMDQPAKEIVKANMNLFTRENGAIIFKGEKYGLHTRVFITAAKHPTYEAKDLANAYKQYESFPFDLNIHVVASEQAGYFQVVFKVLNLLDEAKFKGMEHLAMGMVQLASGKMSSRTGEVLTVDWLLDEVKAKVRELFASGRVEAEDVETVSEQITIGAVKYSVLKTGVSLDAIFDIEKSVSLDGNSGPYLQYTYARTQSVLAKSKIANLKYPIDKFEIGNLPLSQEILLARLLVRFQEVVVKSAEKYSPNILAEFLFTLAREFNSFYASCSILKAEEEQRGLRLFLTAKTGEVLQKGLYLLGIKAPAKM